MNIHERIVMDTIKNERTFSYSIPKGATYQEAYDAAQEFILNIVSMQKQDEEKLAKSTQESSDEQKS